MLSLLIEGLQPVPEVSDGDLVGGGVALDVEMHAGHECLREPSLALLAEPSARMVIVENALEEPFAMYGHSDVDRQVAFAREGGDISRTFLPVVVVEAAVGLCRGLEKHQSIEPGERHVAPGLRHPPGHIAQRVRRTTLRPCGVRGPDRRRGQHRQ